MRSSCRFLAGCLAFVVSAAMGPPPAWAQTDGGAANRKPPAAWTPERVRTFILDVERRIGALWKASHPDGYWKKDLPIAGRCYEGTARALVKASLIVPKVQAMITGKALPCYIATYLGCIVDGWLADPGLNLAVGPPTLPFTKSKVTIVEQTPDRVVADVTEAAYEDVTDGVAGVLKNEKFHPYSDAQAAEITEKSRYTITRGADGIWRISDRDPPPARTPWECRLN